MGEGESEICRKVIDMNKKYQIFVSSTFEDLKEERRTVLSVVQDMGDIPSGMEMFPATDEEQFNFIKRIIDNCDYYVVIVAGRYGSIAPDGLSYTEKEYNYALSKGIRVLAFIRNESEIPVDKRDTDESKIEKLSAFKARLTDGRVAKIWKQSHDLSAAVIVSLTQEKNSYPAVGWVRANQALSNESLIELNELRKEVELLRKYKQQQETKIAYDDIASFDDEIKLNFVHSYYYGYSTGKCEDSLQYILSWRELFSQISPTILQNPNDQLMKIKIGEIFNARVFKKSRGDIKITEVDYETIKIQLKAYGLIELKYSKTTNNSTAWFWNLTPKGEKEMMNSRIIKKDNKNSD